MSFVEPAKDHNCVQLGTQLLIYQNKYGTKLSIYWKIYLLTLTNGHELRTFECS